MKRKSMPPQPSDDVPQASNAEAMDEPIPVDQQQAEDGSDLDDPSELDSYELVDIDEKHWEVFILDADDSNPTAEYGDFWMPD